MIHVLLEFSGHMLICNIGNTSSLKKVSFSSPLCEFPRSVGWNPWVLNTDIWQSKPTALKPKLCNPGTLKPYDPRTFKAWNFQTYNNPQKIQSPEKVKDWNPGTLQLLNEWLPKSFWYVQPCSTTTPKETAPKLKPYNSWTIKPWNLQPWNPKTLRPSNPQTLKLWNLQQPSKNSNPGKKSKTGILEPLNS